MNILYNTIYKIGTIAMAILRKALAHATLS
jgi:hypothetical protein